MVESRMERLNAAEPAQAEGLLLACCAARRWADELVVRRPYHDLETLEQVSDAIFAELGWADVEQALAAHPRIGERAGGAGREAAWSREEQAAAGADDAAAAELAAANAEYERRHGRVFLICATGLSAGEILAALRARLDNDEQTERVAVREELRKIANLRLRKLVTA
ncbi:MAG TPA: 2-oxo-4-hydroxy-4-carboxy-5-ureidoimidazoline decarboxylase [Actinophytocola sp.]|uniref:2-oxo-4-hydroxy-4-carboxy-5-ureidoimidazoline decarboxylase n=1 Tax=Actinophytocola sp. TaxID=1872138 RepID=UPI002DB88466|nr:2-oxo-4-hydroxy-4-carboxy-5-ureidoimidazoline decarboxylase [Actinophytocola sp.]HEU5476024.1 2-oxo-4-hydroxy-4-carboxy-5-ureidoimidazoline decarboxylase [Actinophytocola sp.]